MGGNQENMIVCAMSLWISIKVSALINCCGIGGALVCGADCGDAMGEDVRNEGKT